MAKISSCQEFFDTLKDRFDPESAKGVTADIVYDLKGEGGGEWTVKIADGVLTSVESGGLEKPTLTVTMDTDNFLPLQNGELDGRKAFLTRKLKVKGNIALAQKMGKFFPPG